MPDTWSCCSAGDLWSSIQNITNENGEFCLPEMDVECEDIWEEKTCKKMKKDCNNISCVKENCMKTCGFCKDDDDCKDIWNKKKCKKSKKKCQKKKVYEKCMKTCGKCGNGGDMEMPGKK